MDAEKQFAAVKCQIDMIDCMQSVTGDKNMGRMMAAPYSSILTDVFKESESYDDGSRDMRAAIMGDYVEEAYQETEETAAKFNDLNMPTERIFQAASFMISIAVGRCSDVWGFDEESFVTEINKNLDDELTMVPLSGDVDDADIPDDVKDYIKASNYRLN